MKLISARIPSRLYDKMAKRRKEVFRKTGEIVSTSSLIRRAIEKVYK